MTPIVAAAAPPRVLAANQIAPYRATQAGKVRQPLGELFGLQTFGVNRTSLAPGAVSALFHRHEREDEFVYVLAGELVLRYGNTEMLLTAGMCMGFAAGGVAHQLVNRSSAEAVVLEIGDRASVETIHYPDDDLTASVGSDGRWSYIRADGTAWE